ncbi:SPOR domain-containing protein [Qipengyuania sp. 6B39]|uniref:SPOR domain-containing protein n=1 Tax=Qipengyuania proteolytica TaxID=2867239 RepID=UPI001C8A9910|nr:SPOR domain-containing protein [Qipengyuania proteolytica]MBX7496835.1 SPOR domain-containing protein [Qipengyuania proteolytica]
MSTESKAKTTRFVRLAVTTALATTALAGCTGKVAPSHAYSASQAETALKKGKDSKAIQQAEAAVLAAPRDAYTRTLLGNAYLEAGRFTSAATTFGEAIELGDTAPRTIISYSLALTAMGDRDGAIRVLRAHEAAIDAADFGLALALAGQPQQGVHVLSNALKGGQNTAKVRQNLAYAFALSGDWSNARLLASQDVPGDQLGERMSEWARLAQADEPTVRVASLLGVDAVADPGQPAMLALVNHPANGQLALEASQQVDQVAEAPHSDFAMASELPPVVAAPVAQDAGEAAFAEAGLETYGEQRFVAAEVAQPAPAPVAAKVAAPRVAALAPAGKPTLAAPSVMASGDYNIQLGSFFSMSDAQAAWKIFQSRYPELADAEKVITKARVNGKIYYRVAAAGYAKASAQSMCRTVKAGGHGCIAYAASNPLPGALNVVGNEVRVAAR